MKTLLLALSLIAALAFYSVVHAVTIDPDVKARYVLDWQMPTTNTDDTLIKVPLVAQVWLRVIGGEWAAVNDPFSGTQMSFKSADIADGSYEYTITVNAVGGLVSARSNIIVVRVSRGGIVTPPPVDPPTPDAKTPNAPNTLSITVHTR